MKVNLREIKGNWDQGHVLDKHTLWSTFIGYNEQGHPQFDTKRTEAGEALFQLKYRNGRDQAAPLAQQIATSIVPLFDKVELIIPMPATNVRAWQPVDEVAKELGKLINVPVIEGALVKLPQDTHGPQLKDLATKEEKVAALKGRFAIKDVITNDGHWNALLLDDLFDSGASMEAATALLRTYTKLNKIYTAALTWS
jgi:predicted amidophosphoribosyltransferase